MATFETMEASQQSVSKRQRQTHTKPKQDRLPQSMLGFPYFHRAAHILMYTTWLTMLKSMVKRDRSVPSVPRSRRILEVVADTNQQLPSHGPCSSHIRCFFWAVNYRIAKLLVWWDIGIFTLDNRIFGFQVLRNTRSLVLESTTMFTLKSNEHMTGILQMCFVRDAKEKSYKLPIGIQFTYPCNNIPKTPLPIYLSYVNNPQKRCAGFCSVIAIAAFYSYLKNYYYNITCKTHMVLY